MTTETVLTNTQVREFRYHNFPNDLRMVRAIEQAVLQSPEVQRLRNIEKAALGVLNWTHVKHRPPVREAFPCGESVTVRVHALADLHDALHPDSPARTALIEGRGHEGSEIN